MKLAEKLRPRIDALQIASRYDDSNARIIVSGAPQDNAAKLLYEINETVLGRCLQFETDAGAALSLDVSGRRVLRISGDLAADPSGAEPLSEEEGADEVLQAIRDLTNSAAKITVTTAGLPKGSDSGTFGLPVAHLADLMSVNLYEELGSPPASPAMQFLQQVDGAKAWLIVKGADAGTSAGDSDLVKTLHVAAHNEIANIDEQLEQLGVQAGSPGCVVIGGLSEEGNSIVCLRVAGQLALAIIPAAQLGLILSAWKNMQNSL